MATLTAERDRLRKSLLAAGFTDRGGELWMPPIPKEAKVLVDMLQETQAELEQARADVRELVECLAALAQHFAGEYSNDPRSDRLIDLHKDASESVARALLAKHRDPLQDLADNAKQIGLTYEDKT